MKVLVIGENAAHFAREIWDDAQIDTTTLIPGKGRKDYDAVLSYMNLPKIPYQKVLTTVKAWVETLRTGGELTIMCPSLEWAAVQILSPERNPALIIHLFGTQDKNEHYHASGYTLMDLRTLLSMAGVAVTHAATGEYSINDNVCEMHAVRGVKK